MNSYQAQKIESAWSPDLASDLKDFYVVGVVSNPVRFKSRYSLTEKFIDHMRKTFPVFRTNFQIVELQQGERPFAFEQPEDLDRPILRLRTREEMWFKERMIVLGVQRLPIDWKYVCWIDMDVLFADSNWAHETWHQLQTYEVVQMFSHAINLGPQGEYLSTQNGFVWSYHQNSFMPPNKYGMGGQHGADAYAYWHPGFAWACTRQAFDGAGIIDFCVVGSGDYHMAYGLIGLSDWTIPKKIGERYRDEVMDWEMRALDCIKKNIGFTPGTLVHSFHGKKKDRRYIERWDILFETDFDPDDDIYPDAQGLWRFAPDKTRLRDLVRGYFRVRNEDSIDL
jgi:hypothetical protein